MAYLDDVYAVVQIQPTGVETFVRLSQNENGRELYFAIQGGELPSGSTATISGTKPDGVVYSASAAVSGNVVTVNEDIQMTAAAGAWPAKLRILNGGQVIATGRIRFVIDADPVAPGSVPSDSELEGLVAEAAAYAEAARNSAYYGSPLVAATVAGMTDHTRVYVYTGSESGYTNGNWYYWNGSAWTSGGVYNAQGISTDTTLTIAGKAADAKATGDRLTAAENDISDVKSDLEESVRYDIYQTKTDEEQRRARQNIGLTEDKILTTDIKNAILDVLKKVMYIDQSDGAQAYNNLRDLFFYSGEYEYITENDIMSMFGVTLNGDISEGHIPISSVPASGAIALTFSPSIKHVRGSLGHASASYAHNHLYIFRVVDADTLYGVINNRCVVLTLDRSTNSYSVAFNDNIATLNMIKNRPNTYLELEIINGVLYAYDEDGEVEMSVTNANCIGIWANSGTGVPTVTLNKMTVAHRMLMAEDIDSSVGYTGLNINNGSVSVTAQNTYSALVLSATSVRSIFTILYNNAEATSLPYIVYKKLSNGNLNAHSGGTNYLLTLNSSTNRYTGTASTNPDVIVASRNRTSRKMQFDLVDGVFYGYTPTDGLLFMINNANCIGIWTANNTGGNGNLGVFDAEVQE